MYLRKFLYYKPYYIPFNKVIRVIFYPEYLLIINCLLVTEKKGITPYLVNILVSQLLINGLILFILVNEIINFFIIGLSFLHFTVSFND